MIYLLELDAYDDTGEEPVTRTLRFGSEGYVTEPGDTPANAYYEARLIDPGNVERSIYAPGQAFGGVSVGRGDILLANADDGLADLKAYALDGRAVRLFALASRTAPFADARLVFAGIVAYPTWSWSQLRLVVRDRLGELDRPLQTNLYAGTTTAGGMDEAEGRPEDLKDSPKPIREGFVENALGIAANVFDGIYDLNDGPVDAVSAAYDGGSPLAFDDDYATIALLRAASLGSGEYATCLAAGKARLGSEPDFDVTFDFTVGATSAHRTAAQVALRLLTDRLGIGTADIDVGSFDALDLANDAEIGFEAQAGERGHDAVQRVLASVGAALIEIDGRYTVLRFEAPSGTPVAVLDSSVGLELDEGSGIEVLPTGDDGRGVPAWRVALDYRPVWHVQDAGRLAGGVGEERKAFVGRAFRQSVWEDAAIVTKHPLSPTLSAETLLVDAAAAAAEATRRGALYGVARDRLLVPLSADLDELATIRLGSVVELRFRRFGMAAGKSFRVIGRIDELARNLITLDLWG